MRKMPSENSIHIRLDYDEAFQAKRSMLYSQMSSLKIAQRIERYAALRGEELSLKAKIYAKMKDLRLSIKKMQDMIPAPKIPGLLKRGKSPEKYHSYEENHEYNGPENPINPESNVESQLREIQRRLEELQRRS